METRTAIQPSLILTSYCSMKHERKAVVGNYNKHRHYAVLHKRGAKLIILKTGFTESIRNTRILFTPLPYRNLPLYAQNITSLEAGVTCMCASE